MPLQKQDSKEPQHVCSTPTQQCISSPCELPLGYFSDPRSIRRWHNLRDAALVAGASVCAIVVQSYTTLSREALKEEASGGLAIKAIKRLSMSLSSWADESRNLPRLEKLKENHLLRMIQSRISSILENSNILQQLADPPPLLFIIACVSLACIAAHLRHLHRTDRYRDRILGGGVLISIAAASQSASPLMSLKAYLSWLVILSLGFSVLLHSVLTWWTGKIIHIDVATPEENQTVGDSPDSIGKKERSR
ncbi:hypothetical protein B0O99DRAFT_682116 [Bisporella sp. PMI_857]|nr:hypothetical protein B0O99DRAFT_682877 [Bisporella sp. PMI_857]KAH8600429.1 hypothetical protein B0O99DRAFT_682116 [Bisporella sp. PMI_857]